MNYENGLKILEGFVKLKEPESLEQFDLARLREFLDQKSNFGKNVNAEISEVIHHLLNPLARRLTEKSFSDLCKQSNYEQPGTADNFDLDDLIDDCDEKLLGKRGLVGLGVHCSSRLFLKHFQKRLAKRLGKVHVSSLEDLHPWTDIKINIRSIKGHRKNLDKQNVLLDIIVSSENAAINFWQTITEEFKAQFNNRLIIIMMTENFLVPKLCLGMPASMLCIVQPHRRTKKWDVPAIA